MDNQLSFYQQKLENEIDSWDLYESVNKGENIAIIDARSGEAYSHEHIPGAINLPHRQMNHETTADLDKKTLYITYCDGIGCNASTKAALNMTMLGFRVKELIGGLDWWKRDGYETAGTKGISGKQIACAC